MNIVHDASRNARKVGDIVYPGYSPQAAGVIIKVEIPAPQKSMMVGSRPDDYFISFPTYTIRTPAGREFTSSNVQLYQTLIDDHRKKLATHEAAMERIQAWKKTTTLT